MSKSAINVLEMPETLDALLKALSAAATSVQAAKAAHEEASARVTKTGAAYESAVMVLRDVHDRLNAQLGLETGPVRVL